MTTSASKFKILHFVLFVAYFANPGIALSNFREDKNIDDNLTVLNNLAQQVAEDIVYQIVLNKTAELIIVNIPPADESSWLLETKLLPLVIARDIAVSNSSYSTFTGDSLETKTNANSYVLSYKITEIGITYAYLNRGLFRDDKIEREAVLRVFVKLSNNDNLIIWSDEIEKKHNDSFFSSQLKHVNNPDFSFTFSEPPASFGVKKLIEPLITIGVTGTIIYLFFAFRSK